MNNTKQAIHRAFILLYRLKNLYEVFQKLSQRKQQIQECLSLHCVPDQRQLVLKKLQK